MNSQTNNHRVLRAIIRAIASEEFEAEDYRVALNDLREKRALSLVEELLSFLKEAGQRPSPSNRTSKEPSSKEKLKGRSSDELLPDQMFDVLRRRKVTRQALIDMLSRISPEFLPQADRLDAMRQVLHVYYDFADKRDWELLRRMIEGDVDRDPYLDSIVSGR